MEQEQQEEQFVPQGPCSLSSDAPGWSSSISISLSSEQKCKIAPNENSTNKNTNEEGSERGPTCWKCRGAGSIPDKIAMKKKRQNKKAKIDDVSSEISMEKKACPVCQSKGYLPTRTKLVKGKTQLPVITRARKSYNTWNHFGPQPLGVVQLQDTLQTLQQSDKNEESKNKKEAIQQALEYLTLASYSTKDVEITIKSQLLPHCPKWLPLNPGEQLCNLVGSFRILQNIGSHRWTTDDFMTAYIASRTFLKLSKERGEKEKVVRYLDLGTGNGSVLQMVLWYLLHLQQQKKDVKDRKIEAVGVEARAEAVTLARRSLSFNIGACACRCRHANESESDVAAEIIRADFRDLINYAQVPNTPTTITEHRSDNDKDNDNGEKETSNKAEKERQRKIWNVANQKYDLITGTPPYFRVDFKTTTTSKKEDDDQAQITSSAKNNTSIHDSKNNKTVTSAIINQGGMPTSIQSAPARCEFRGGIEAYCHTASTLLKESGEEEGGGRFVVCENWLNHDRVHKSAHDAQLDILCVHPVKGKVDRKDNLFAIYVMAKKKKKEITKEAAAAVMDINQVVVRQQPALAVRDKSGKWTEEYADILESMSIPARHETSRGVD